MGNECSRGSLLLNTVFVLFMASASVAAGSSAACMSPGPLENNFTACRPGVQSAIQDLHKVYGEFDITCKNGFLSELSIALDSPLAKVSPSEFVSSHWELFLSSAPLRPIEIKDTALHVKGYYTGNQQYKGFPIRNGFAEGTEHLASSCMPKSLFRFRFGIVDTSLWNLEPKVKLDCAKAVELSLKHDEKQGIANGWTYKCYSRDVELDASSFPDGPKLVWAVAAWKEPPPKKNSDMFTHYGDELVSLRIIHVDANSGKLHAFPWKINRAGMR